MEISDPKCSGHQIVLKGNEEKRFFFLFFASFLFSSFLFLLLFSLRTEERGVTVR
jgi:hypothetical protein